MKWEFLLICRADIDNATMRVLPATFGNGVEVICRYRAVGALLEDMVYAKKDKF